MNKIIHKWHSRLGMPKKDLEWHREDIAEEFQELIEARGLINIWSEISDVSYTYTRALWSGYDDLCLPISKTKYMIGLIYMFPKYTLRWNFYHAVGKKFEVEIHEVRNPRKVHKLKHIARKYSLDEEKFEAEAKKLMKYRFFFK